MRTFCAGCNRKFRDRSPHPDVGDKVYRDEQQPDYCVGCMREAQQKLKVWNGQ